MIDMLKLVLFKWINGKSIAYVAFAYVQGGLVFVLAYARPETNWIGLAAALAAVNTPFYAGGGWKNHSDAQQNSVPKNS